MRNRFYFVFLKLMLFAINAQAQEVCNNYANQFQELKVKVEKLKATTFKDGDFIICDDTLEVRLPLDGASVSDLAVSVALYVDKTADHFQKNQNRLTLLIALAKASSPSLSIMREKLSCADIVTIAEFFQDDDKISTIDVHELKQGIVNYLDPNNNNDNVVGTTIEFLVSEIRKSKSDVESFSNRQILEEFLLHLINSEKLVNTLFKT